MKRVLLIISVVLFVTVSPSRAEEPICIGLLAELTGQLSIMGEDCRRGYEAAKSIFAPDDKVNGVRVRFVLGDSKGAAVAGLSEFRRLVDIENAIAVVTTRSPVGLALNPVSKKKKIPLIGIVGHPDFIPQNEFAYRIWPSAVSEGVALGKKAAKLGKLKAALVTLEDDYFLAISEGFQKSLTKHKGEIVFSENILPSDHDFSSLIGKLRRSNPDVVLVNVGPVQAGVFVRKLRENGFARQILSNFLIGTPEALKNAGHSAEGVIFVEVNFDKPSFIAELVKKFGEKRSSPVGYSCFIGLSAVLQTLGSNPSIKDPESMHKALSAIDKVKLPDGNVKFIGREAQLELAYRSINNGKVDQFD